MPPSDDTPGNDDLTTGAGQQLVELAAKLLGSLVTAAGFLGFVAFTGAAILWVRFDAVHLPPDQAVSVVAQRELLAVGAVALVGFVVIGLAAVAVGYMLDRRGVPSSPTRLGLLVLGVAGVILAVFLAAPQKGHTVDAALIVLAAGMLFALVSIIFSEARQVPRGWPLPPEQEPPPATYWAFVTHLKTHVKSGFERLREASASTPRRMQLTTRGRVLQMAIVIIGGIGIYFCFCTKLHTSPQLLGCWRMPGIYALAALLYLVCLSVAQGTKDVFLWYGVTVFAAVAVFGAAVSLLRVADAKKVQAAAVLVTGQRQPICGVYVTETGDRMYLGRLDSKTGPHTGRTGHLFWIAKPDVASWSITPPQSTRNAGLAVHRLSDELLMDRHTRTTSKLTTTRTRNKNDRVVTKTRETKSDFQPRANKQTSCYLRTKPKKTP